LTELDLIASDVAGKGKESWSYCDQCGVLYYAPTNNSHCPGAPQGDFFPPRHGQRQSFNYVLRCDPVTVNDSMQDGWGCCKNCGDLFHSGAGNVCPATGAHDTTGSPNYMIGYGTIPDASDRGFDAQDGWCFCGKCGALYYGGAGTPSRCPAGGGHVQSGTANYWLPYLAMLPRTYRPPWAWSP
jgi:hypothetical protein